MRSIIDADSAADLTACSLTMTGSTTPLFSMFSVFPVNTFTPMYFPSVFSCAALSSTIMSIGSSPRACRPSLREFKVEHQRR